MFDLISIIQSVGYFGVFGIIFSESFLVFFLPGDSLLFTAGFLASQNFLNIFILIIGCFIAAIIGNNMAYAFGRRIGPAIFNKQNSFLFNPERVKQASIFYEKHGPKTIILARFVPFVRTFAPILAGVAEMNYSVFFAYNLIGGALWTIGLSLAGFFLGRIIPDVDTYILPIIGVIIILSVIPVITEVIKSKRKNL